MNDKELEETIGRRFRVVPKGLVYIVQVYTRGLILHRWRNVGFTVDGGDFVTAKFSHESSARDFVHNCIVDIINGKNPQTFNFGGYEISGTFNSSLYDSVNY